MKVKTTLGVLALSITLAGCSTGKTETKMDEEVAAPVEETAPAKPAALYQDGLKRLNDGGPMGEGLAESVVMVDATKTSTGKAEVVAALDALTGPFPDIKIDAARIIVLGPNTIAVQGVFTGTHTAPMGEMPATNKAVGNVYIHIVTYADGQITRIEALSNPMTMMQQLGAMPAPEGKVPALATRPASTEVIEGAASADNEAIAMAYFAAITAGDNAALAGMVSEDFTIVHHGMNKTMTLAQAGEHMKMLSGGLTEMSLIPQKLWSAGDYVVARVPFAAKHTGELMGMPATNKAVSTPVLMVMKMAGGKVAKVTEYINIMHFAGQMAPPQQQQAAK